MYKVMLILKEKKKLDAIKNMSIWGKSMGFEIVKTMDNGFLALKEMRQNTYDLVIAGIEISGMDGLWLLKTVKEEGLCRHVVICSEALEFHYARSAVVYGAFDYFVEPFQEMQFREMLCRIAQETGESKNIVTNHINEIVKLFTDYDKGIYQYVINMADEIYTKARNIKIADKMIRDICSGALEKLFDENEWLDLYVIQNDYLFAEEPEDIGWGLRSKIYSEKIFRLFEEYCELFPVHNETIKDVILYILNNPESDLRQKTIAARMNLNSSYLSTIFIARTEERFVDYITLVKLKRARFLLKETTLKVSEIARRLDYKDVGYFSRMFKKQYGMVPSQYRIPENYDYQI